MNHSSPMMNPLIEQENLASFIDKEIIKHVTSSTTATMPEDWYIAQAFLVDEKYGALKYSLKIIEQGLLSSSSSSTLLVLKRQVENLIYLIYHCALPDDLLSLDVYVNKMTPSDRVRFILSDVAPNDDDSATKSLVELVKIRLLPLYKDLKPKTAKEEWLSPLLNEFMIDYVKRTGNIAACCAVLFENNLLPLHLIHARLLAFECVEQVLRHFTQRSDLTKQQLVDLHHLFVNDAVPSSTDPVEAIESSLKTVRGSIQTMVKLVEKALQCCNEFSLMKPPEFFLENVKDKPDELIFLNELYHHHGNKQALLVISREWFSFLSDCDIVCFLFSKALEENNREKSSALLARYYEAYKNDMNETYVRFFVGHLISNNNYNNIDEWQEKMSHYELGELQNVKKTLFDEKFLFPIQVIEKVLGVTNEVLPIARVCNAMETNTQGELLNALVKEHPALLYGGVVGDVSVWFTAVGAALKIGLGTMFSFLINNFLSVGEYDKAKQLFVWFAGREEEENAPNNEEEISMLLRGLMELHECVSLEEEEEEGRFASLVFAQIMRVWRNSPSVPIQEKVFEFAHRRELKTKHKANENELIIFMRFFTCFLLFHFHREDVTVLGILEGDSTVAWTTFQVELNGMRRVVLRNCLFYAAFSLWTRSLHLPESEEASGKDVLMVQDYVRGYCVKARNMDGKSEFANRLCDVVWNLLNEEAEEEAGEPETVGLFEGFENLLVVQREKFSRSEQYRTKELSFFFNKNSKTITHPLVLTEAVCSLLDHGDNNMLTVQVHEDVRVGLVDLIRVYNNNDNSSSPRLLEALGKEAIYYCLVFLNKQKISTPSEWVLYLDYFESEKNKKRKALLLSTTKKKGGAAAMLDEFPTVEKVGEDFLFLVHKSAEEVSKAIAFMDKDVVKTIQLLVALYDYPTKVKASRVLRCYLEGLILTTRENQKKTPTREREEYSNVLLPYLLALLDKLGEEAKEFAAFVCFRSFLPSGFRADVVSGCGKEEDHQWKSIMLEYLHGVMDERRVEWSEIDSTVLGRRTKHERYFVGMDEILLHCLKEERDKVRRECAMKHFALICSLFRLNEEQVLLRLKGEEVMKKKNDVTWLFDFVVMQKNGKQILAALLEDDLEMQKRYGLINQEDFIRSFFQAKFMKDVVDEGKYLGVLMTLHGEGFFKQNRERMKSFFELYRLMNHPSEYKSLLFTLCGEYIAQVTEEEEEEEEEIEMCREPLLEFLGYLQTNANAIEWSGKLAVFYLERSDEENVTKNPFAGFEEATLKQFVGFVIGERNNNKSQWKRSVLRCIVLLIQWKLYSVASFAIQTNFRMLVDNTSSNNNTETVIIKSFCKTLVESQSNQIPISAKNVCAKFC